MFLFYIVLVLYLATIFLKVVWGILGNNNALFADGLDSTKNLITLFISFLFFRLSKQAPDKTHHFGHSKYDAFGSLIIGISQIFFAGIAGTTVFFTFGQKPYHTSLMHSLISLIFMGIVVLFLFFLFRRLGSEAIKSEFWHEFIDLLQTAGVFISTYLSLNFVPEVNSIFAGGISALLLINGIKSVISAEKPLVDRAPSDSVINTILSTAKEYDIDVRDLKTSISGKDVIRVEVSIQIDKEIGIQDAHSIAHAFENSVIMNLKKLGFRVENFAVHIEPRGAHPVELKYEREIK